MRNKEENKTCKQKENSKSVTLKKKEGHFETRKMKTLKVTRRSKVLEGKMGRKS